VSSHIDPSSLDERVDGLRKVLGDSWTDRRAHHRRPGAGSLTPGGLITFYGYTAYLSWPLWVFTSSVQDYTRAVVGARRPSRLLEGRPPAGGVFTL